jgi:hypothetical protein
MQLQLQHVATASWQKEKILIHPIIGAAEKRRMKYETGRHREHQRPQPEVYSLQITPLKVSFAAAQRSSTDQPRQDVVAGPASVEQLRVSAPVQHHQQQQGIGQSVRASNVNSSSLNDMFKVATVVQQIMTGLNEAMSVEDKIVAITKIFLNLMNSNGC